jgi:hypothetical protein
MKWDTEAGTTCSALAPAPAGDGEGAILDRWLYDLECEVSGWGHSRELSTEKARARARTVAGSILSRTERRFPDLPPLDLTRFVDHLQLLYTASTLSITSLFIAETTRDHAGN